ncbi:MAG: UDP-N-acetylmuramoyl-tripeptide--D-alanyl-D-alanine ligase [Flavobacteriales bacterium]
MEIQQLYALFLQQDQKVSTDTRKLEKGSIFFALKGDTFNANEFAVSAIESGCSYAVVDDKNIQHSQCIAVDDVLQTLQDLARHHRRQFSIPVIGITGTNGKTTTKELVNQVLSTKYTVHCTKGNFNNHIGVPLTLLSMAKETEIAIIEMGANHPLEIEFLCKIAEPNYGLVTNMGKAHLEGFGGFDGVIKTKSEMYQFLTVQQGKVFVNASDELLMKQSALAPQRLFYQDIQLNGAVISTNPTVKFQLNFGSESIEIASNLFGEHNLINMLCAARVGVEFGVSLSEIKQALESYHPDNNRSQVVLSEKGNTLIWDAYNANPTSMSAAVNAFAHTPNDKKVAILGDMLELGEEANKEHQAMIALLTKLNLQAYLVGPEFVKCSSTYKSFANAIELKEYLIQSPLNNHSVLIKGSRGIKLETLKEVL